jgi:peptidoglycan/LPS O-acetylase OafA/YrhL
MDLVEVFRWPRFEFFRNEAISISCMVFTMGSATYMIWSETVYVTLWKLHFGRIEHNVWSVIFSVLIVGAACGRVRFLSSGPLRNLGKVSFSLYLIHPLIMLGMMRLGFVEAIKNLDLGLGPQLALSFVITDSVIWAVSNLTYRFIESSGQTLGRRFTDRFFGGIWTFVPSRDRARVRSPRLHRIEQSP